MTQPNRLPADSAHQFGGIELDRGKPLSLRLDGHHIDGFAGDTVLSAALAAGIDTRGQLGELPLALTERFAPLVVSRRDATNPRAALPMNRAPALDGLDLVTLGPRTGSAFSTPFNRGTHSLRHRLETLTEPAWLRTEPETTLIADLLIIGGGVAGLTAADAAATAGHRVILVERRSWLGGDARYFGTVGDEESPEELTNRLLAKVRAAAAITVLTGAEAFAFRGMSALAHHVEAVDGKLRSRVVAITATRILLATGAPQRLPIFAGNRLPGVALTLEAYHLAKRYGIARGRSAIVATQSNYGYRAGLRLHDAGVAVRRVIDSRVNPQSRFVDFAKAGGLNLGSGQIPAAAALGPRRTLGVTFANIGSNTTGRPLEASQLIVSGGFQPDLALWMLAGGGVQQGTMRLEARGHVEHFAIAGSAAGYRSMRACADSGRAAVAELFGARQQSIEDIEIGSAYETPDGPTPIAATVAAGTFLDNGASLLQRPMASQTDQTAGHALSLSDVAASVELGLISAADAGAVAEERGVPGGDLPAADWKPVPAAAPEAPTYLVGRFGPEPKRVHLIVDHKRRFEIGALVYANTARPDPLAAIGVIVEAAPVGGVALVEKAALRKTDRFVVETLAGASPARIAS